MTYKEIIKNRINYYIDRIIELQKQQDLGLHDYTITIEKYVDSVKKSIEELKRIGE